MNALKNLIFGAKQKNDSDIGKLIQRKKDIQVEIRGLMKDRREIEATIEKALINREETGQKGQKGQKEGKLQDKKEETTGTAGPFRKEGTFSPIPTTGEPGPFNAAEKEKIFYLGKGLELSGKEGKEGKEGKIAIAKEGKRGETGTGVELEGEKELISATMEKTKLSNAFLSGTAAENNHSPQKKGKPEGEKAAGSLFGNNLLEELLNDEDLYTEEEQSFLKFLEAADASELVEELKGIRKFLSGECS